MRAAFAAVFSPQLRRTTALLYAIWFVNALTYYGLVLLTTALQTEAKEQECTPAGAPNLDSGDYLVGGRALVGRVVAALCVSCMCMSRWLSLAAPAEAEWGSAGQPQP